MRRCREELEAEQASVQAASEDNLRWRARWEAEHGRKLGGRKPFAPDPDGLAKRSINTTDPDSRRIVRTGKTAVQGYNAQAVATAGQIILAADITQQANDSSQLEPMIDAVLRELARTKCLRGITSFQRRGLEACRAEWQLIATGHNLLKLHTAQAG